MTMTAPTLTTPALIRVLSGLATLRDTLRTSAEARRRDRAVARLGSLSVHYVDDIGLGDSFGIEAADIVAPSPAMRT